MSNSDIGYHEDPENGDGIIRAQTLQKGEGYLLVSRDGVLLIPLTDVQKVILDKTAYEQDTIDIWIVFGEEKVTLSYKRNTLDVTKFRLID